jgi:hypothetical protein
MAGPLRQHRAADLHQTRRQQEFWSTHMHMRSSEGFDFSNARRMKSPQWEPRPTREPFVAAAGGASTWPGQQG